MYLPKKFMFFILRIFSAIIDLFLVYIPISIFLEIFSSHSQQTCNIAAQVIFAVYGVIMIVSFKGRTIGKMIGKLYVEYYTDKPNIVMIALREFGKMIYFLPYIGIVFIVISCIMWFTCKGKMLHDFIGDSEVKSLGESKNGSIE